METKFFQPPATRKHKNLNPENVYSKSKNIKNNKIRPNVKRNEETKKFSFTPHANLKKNFSEKKNFFFLFEKTKAKAEKKNLRKTF